MLPTAADLVNEINGFLKTTGRQLTPNSEKRAQADLQMLANTARYFPQNFNKILRYAGFTTQRILTEDEKKSLNPD